MKKRIALLLSVILLISLASCSGRVIHIEDSAGPRVALVCKALNSSFWMSLRTGAQDSAEAHGIALDVLAPSFETELQEQKMIVDYIVAQDYDAVCIAPCDEGIVSSLSMEPDAADMAIIAVDTPLAHTSHLAYVGSDNLAGGRLAARRMAQLFPDSRNANIAVMMGTYLPSTILDRLTGFQEELGGSGYAIHEPLRVTGEPWNEYAELEAVLTDRPDLDGLLILKPDLSIGALEAIRRCSPDLEVIVFDYSPVALDALNAGMINSFVAQDPYQMGWLAVQQAYNALQGQPVQPVVETALQLVTAENAAAFADSSLNL